MRERRGNSTQLESMRKGMHEKTTECVISFPVDVKATHVTLEKEAECYNRDMKLSYSGNAGPVAGFYLGALFIAAGRQMDSRVRVRSAGREPG